MPTANTYISPDDGWTQIADSPKFVRVTGYPHTHPYYLAAGSSAPSLVAIAGSGAVTFTTGVPIANETVTIGTEVYTFKAARASAFQVTIGATNLLTAANFLTAITTDSTLVTGTRASGVVTLTSIAVGTQGNYALSEAATNVTVGGAAFTGGVDITAGVLVAHRPFVVNVTMAEKLYARVVNPVPNSNKMNGKLRLDVFTVA